MKSRKAEASDLTAAKTRHGAASTYIHADPRLQLPTKPRGRRRIDPLAGIWDDEIVPMLKAAPGLRPIVVFREISHHHPEIRPCARRTLERRIRYWQGLNDPDPDVTFRQGSSPDQRFLTPRLVSKFLRSAHQGMLQLSDLPAQAKTHDSIFDILDFCKSGTLAQRNKALLALAVICDLPLCCLQNTQYQALHRCIDGSRFLPHQASRALCRQGRERNYVSRTTLSRVLSSRSCMSRPSCMTSREPTGVKSI